MNNDGKSRTNHGRLSAMLRRRMKVILIPTLLAPLAGFLVSYAFPAKYTSQSLVLVEVPEVLEGYR